MLLVLSKTDILPVTLAEVKAQARIDEDDEDAVTLSHLLAAIEFAERHTQHILSQCVMQLRLDSWDIYYHEGGRFDISVVPVREIQSVTYFDGDNVEQTILATDYAFERTNYGAVIYFGSDFSFSTVHGTRMNPVRITFLAGYDDPAESGSGDDPMLKIPRVIHQAVLMLAAHWHEFREAVSTVDSTPVAMAARELLSQVRLIQ